MYRPHSASSIFEQDDQVEEKQAVLRSISAQRLITGSKNKTPKDESTRIQQREHSLFYWSRVGALFGATWGLIFDTAVLPIPGLNPDLFAGPLASWIVAVIQDAIMFGCASALCAGLLKMAMRNKAPIQQFRRNER